MQGMHSVTSSPTRQWNMLVDEIKKGLVATQRQEVDQSQLSRSLSPATSLHSTPSFVMPPPVCDITMGKGDYRIEVEPSVVTYSVVTTDPRKIPVPNGDVSNNFLLPPASQTTKMTSHCPLRKVEVPKKFCHRPAYAQSLNNVNYIGNPVDPFRHSRTSYGACNHEALADRRYYVSETLVTSPHTVRNVVTEKKPTTGGKRRRRRRRTASSRIRRKTQIHGRSAAYRIARRNAIKSRRRRRNEITSTKTTFYEPKPTFSMDLVTDNFFLSMFAILCFLPLGVASMCYTLAVRRYLALNDKDNALLSSLKAKKLADTGVMFGITGLATAIVVLVVKANMPYAAVEYDYYLPEYT